MGALNTVNFGAETFEAKATMLDDTHLNALKIWKPIEGVAWSVMKQALYSKMEGLGIILHKIQNTVTIINEKEVVVIQSKDEVLCLSYYSCYSAI